MTANQDDIQTRNTKRSLMELGSLLRAFGPTRKRTSKASQHVFQLINPCVTAPLAAVPIHQHVPKDPWPHDPDMVGPLLQIPPPGGCQKSKMAQITEVRLGGPFEVSRKWNGTRPVPGGLCISGPTSVPQLHS